MKKQNIGYLLLSSLGIISLLGFALSDPIAQNEAYHHFSDQLHYGNIPNFWNVISNLPFLFVGVLGIIRFKKANISWLVFFVGISLVAFGSGYYHLHPTNETLIWDRLPMTIAFTALISALISAFIHQKRGKQLLTPLLALGIISILYWVIYDDLRLYAFVQFYPILAMPIILLLFKDKHQSTQGYWLLLIAYIFAKLFETFDAAIHERLGWISGHSLKHIVAAIGIFLMMQQLNKKRIPKCKIQHIV
ncbi:MAG: DUF6962 family protein [Flammeovirgaceae bacterium]